MTTTTTERKIIDHGTVISIVIGGKYVAGAVRQDESFFERTGYRWHIWATELSIAETSPLAARTESDARRWLDYMADLYEGNR